MFCLTFCCSCQTKNQACEKSTWKRQVKQSINTKLYKFWYSFVIGVKVFYMSIHFNLAIILTYLKLSSFYSYFILQFSTHIIRIVSILLWYFRTFRRKPNYYSIHINLYNSSLGGYTSEPEVTSYSVFAGRDQIDGDNG